MWLQVADDNASSAALAAALPKHYLQWLQLPQLSPSPTNEAPCPWQADNARWIGHGVGKHSTNASALGTQRRDLISPRQNFRLHLPPQKTCNSSRSCGLKGHLGVNYFQHRTRSASLGFWRHFTFDLAPWWNTCFYVSQQNRHVPVVEYLFSYAKMCCICLII